MLGLALASTLISFTSEPERAVVVMQVVNAENATITIDQGMLRKAITDYVGYHLGVVPIAERQNALASLFDCGAELSCATDALRRVGVEIGIRITINIGWRLITLHLIDVERESLAGESVIDLDGGDAWRSQLLLQIDSLLEKGGHPRGGRIVLRVEPRDAEVLVSPEGDRRQDVLVLLPGDYAIRVRKKMYLDAIIPRRVQPGTETTLDVHLDRAPSVSFFESPWLWGAAAAAIVIAGSAAIAIAASPKRCACVTYPGSTCTVCDP